MPKTSDVPHDEYLIYQICPRCRLNLSQDVCVCGWTRPRPAITPRQRDWWLKAAAALTVVAVLSWLVIQVLES